MLVVNVIGAFTTGDGSPFTLVGRSMFLPLPLFEAKRRLTRRNVRSDPVNAEGNASTDGRSSKANNNEVRDCCIERIVLVAQSRWRERGRGIRQWRGSHAGEKEFAEHVELGIQVTEMGSGTVRLIKGAPVLNDVPFGGFPDVPGMECTQK